MKKYKIIYADPPWQYKDKALNRGGAERHYSTEDHKNLGMLDVESLCDNDCVLFMWATFPKIQEALDLISLWGFEYKTSAFTWIKKNKVSDSYFWGMGSWTRANAEVCLLATRGRPKRVDMGVHSIIDAKIQKHSEKPQEARDKILRLIGDVPRLEMFARDSENGWDVFGNECKNSIEIPLKKI